jgi:hypothetical protein
MRGELHGLKTLVLAENPHAFYVHCFAHQLQLVVVAVVKGVLVVGNFFGHLNKIVNMVSHSSLNIFWSLPFVNMVTYMAF